MRHAESGVEAAPPNAYPSAMQEDGDTDCAGECNYFIRRETRTRADGGTVVEEVERCTGCGRVISRKPVPDAIARSG